MGNSKNVIVKAMQCARPQAQWMGAVTGRTKGFTLIELMVTLAVLAVLLMMATPSFIEWRRSTEVIAATNTFVNAMAVARSEALKRNTAVDIEFFPDNAAVTGWRVYEDTDFDGGFDETKDDLIAFSAPFPESLQVTTNNEKIRYDGSGFAKGAATATIKVGVLGADKKEIKAMRHIVVSNTGRVRTCTPAKLDGKTSC